MNYRQSVPATNDNFSSMDNRLDAATQPKKERTGNLSPLEKELGKFQKMLAEISLLETHSQQQKVHDDEYHRLYMAKVHPLLVEVAKAQLIFVNQIELVFNAGKFSKNVEARFVDFVIPMLRDAEVYFEEAGSKLKNYRVWQASLVKKEQVSVEPASIDESKKEEEQTDPSTFRNQYKSNNNDSMEDFAGRSVAALYKELAKMLHPDLEQDEAKKDEKQEMMKTLVDAKNDDDLYAMLQMRQRALALNNIESADTNVFSLQELKAYNELLKQKLDKLKLSIHQHFFSGNNNGNDFFAKTRKQLSPAKRVKEDVKNLRALQESLLHNARVITSSNQLKELLDL